MAKYEAHITLDKIHAPSLKEDNTAIRSLHELKGWQYSAIDDDPLMGQKPYCYLTAYDPDPVNLLKRLEDACFVLLAMCVDPLRGKIERIIYDSKTGVDEITSKV